MSKKSYTPNNNDKYYTNPLFALKCINKVFELYPKNSFDLIIDPGAGNGSFFK